MRFKNRRFTLAIVAAAALAAWLPSSARAQLYLGIDPHKLAIQAAAKQLAPFVTEQTPIRLDPVELYPTVDALPGAAFKASTSAGVIKDVIAQLRHSTTGTVSLAPGDYAIAARLYCMSHSRPARAPLAFLLGPMRGKHAAAIIAMNSRAAGSAYQFAQLQTTSWTIQSGLALSEFSAQPKDVVDKLIPDYAAELATDSYQSIQAKWNDLAGKIPGAPSLDSTIGQLGGAGQAILAIKAERDDILNEASDFDALRNSFAPAQTSSDGVLPTPWSVVSDTVSMRMRTEGHYGDVGTIEIRVSGTSHAQVPLVSSIAMPRCHSEISKAGSAYTCTQPLSFVPKASE